MPIEIDLTPFGFTATESEAYAALLRLGPSRGYAVAHATRVARANTYGALEGLVGRTAALRLPGRPARYRATDPAALIVQLAAQQGEALDRLSRSLRDAAGPAEPETRSVTGGRAVANLIIQVVARAERRVEGVLSAELLRPTLPAWRRAKERAALELRVAGDVPAEASPILSGTVSADAPIVLLIALDNGGFGLSDKPPAPYDNAAYARLAIAFMASLGLPDAVLVGHSMGGAIAAEVVIEHPQRVRGLVLVGSAGLGTREPLLFRVVRWPVLGPAVLAFRGRGLTARLLKSTYFDPRKVTEADVDQYYAPVAVPDYGRALRGALRQFRFDDLGGRLDRIAAPTLVLWGEEVRWAPLGLARALAGGVTRSAFLSVPHAGPSVPEEAPDEGNRLFIAFLRDGLPRIPADLALAR